MRTESRSPAPSTHEGALNGDLRGMCVHQRFHALAGRAPNALAVSAGGQKITYGELDVWSNRLAHYLQSFGIVSGTVVGLCMERSIEQIVGALAILKAGGAYLPLDPSYPSQRLEYMLGDAKAAVLLTEENIAERVSGGSWRVVCLHGADQKEIERQSAQEPGVSVARENLAYVIFTSGSTGVPKGVAVTHDNLLNLVDWHHEAFNVTAADRATYIAGLGFDATVWELWPYLTAGASMHLPPESIRSVPEQLRDWLVAQNISISFEPTPLAERLIVLPWPANTALRILLTGGDVLHDFTPAKLPFAVVNNYGPTECTVVATSGQVPMRGDSTGIPSIGRAIANVRIYILDENRKLVLDGTAGEMYIGGRGVARGYLNHPEMTAERFLPDPFHGAAGGRMYRTGDLARVLPTGEIAFLGRIDNQVKIRGFRVELDEIVSVLKAHPSVQQAVVVAQDVANGEKNLVAYVVPVPASETGAAELKAALRSRLPGYMVPASFVKLQTLPLSPSGKVDRAALPAPTAANTLRDDPFVAPRSPIEERISEILAPLLGLDCISVEDNFFMLGGHSLLGTQLIARLREAFGVDLSLRDIFDGPTVAELSSQVETLLVAKLESLTDEQAERELNLLENRPADGA